MSSKTYDEQMRRAVTDRGNARAEFESAYIAGASRRRLQRLLEQYLAAVVAVADLKRERTSNGAPPSGMSAPPPTLSVEAARPGSQPIGRTASTTTSAGAKSATDVRQDAPRRAAS